MPCRAHGAGGEIGHLCVNYQETETCGCGKKGCLEQYASATGITRLANMRLAKDEKPSTLRNVAEMSAKEVFDAVKAGDEVAIEIATEFGKYLGHALANLAAACDPAVIVIGGGVSKPERFCWITSKDHLKKWHSLQIKIQNLHLQSLQMMQESAEQQNWY